MNQSGLECDFFLAFRKIEWNMFQDVQPLWKSLWMSAMKDALMALWTPHLTINKTICTIDPKSHKIHPFFSTTKTCKV